MNFEKKNLHGLVEMMASNFCVEGNLLVCNLSFHLRLAVMQEVKTVV